MNERDTHAAPPTSTELDSGRDVPQEIKEAIDRVALFIGQWEEDMFGEFHAKTRLAQDVCRLVTWAFKNERGKSRFVAFLENREPKPEPPYPAGVDDWDEPLF